MNENKDKLIFKRESVPTTGWKPITVSTEAYLQIKNIAEETNQPISKVAGQLIEFAVERVVIQK